LLRVGTVARKGKAYPRVFAIRPSIKLATAFRHRKVWRWFTPRTNGYPTFTGI